MDLDYLIRKKLLLVTGKGGIGKSLVAASLGLAAAERGLKVCIVESASDDQLAPLFGLPAIGHKLTAINERLHIINLDPQENFRDFVVLHLGQARIFEKVFTKTIVRSFIQMIPGIAELTLLGRLYYFAELSPQKFDLVIFDGFASGHFHSLMTSPDAIIQSGLVGPVVQETTRVKDYLSDHAKTGIVLLTTSEDLVVTECLEFADKFERESPAKLAMVLVNRYYPEWNPGCDAIPAVHPALAPALTFLKRRSEGVQEQIRVLKSGLNALPRSGPPPKVALLRELGAIDEPISAAFAENWLVRAEEEPNS